MLLPLASARLSLLASTALSASYPTSLKLIYAADGAPLSPAVITALRFAVMAGLAQLVLTTTPASSSGGSEEDGVSPGFWPAAAELGFWACAGAQLNTASLREISVVRGALLLASINVLTPTLSSVLGTTDAQRQLTPRTWAACLLALASSVVALADDAAATGVAPSGLQLSFGDALMLGAACCYATQQVRLSALVVEYPPKMLAAARLQTQAACSLAFLLPLAVGGADGGGGALPWAVLSEPLSVTQGALIAFSAVCAVIGTVLQFQGQRVVPAASAQPIYASSPVLAALWAFVVLHEPVTQSEVLGAVGVCGAAVLAGATNQTAA